MTAKYMEPPGAPPQRNTNTSRRILVAEDDALMLRVNVKMLAKSGYAVDGAADGALAWDALQLNSYDLLITENKMPKLSGVDLLRKMFAAQMALPVIMVSQAMPMDELSREPWLQIDAMLAKSYAVEEFLVAVRNVLLANHDAHDEIGLPSIWQN